MQQASLKPKGTKDLEWFLPDAYWGLGHLFGIKCKVHVWDFEDTQVLCWLEC